VLRAAAGEVAAQLPWLWPDATSLSVLGQPQSLATWPALRLDPAALLLVFRNRQLRADTSDLDPQRASRFLEPSVLETVESWFHHDRGLWVDWRQPATLPYYRSALSIAQHALILAHYTRCSDPVAAWSAGMLAPLGWLAMAAVHPELASECLADPAHAGDPLGTQERHWGFDQNAIARRLARRWLLPDWLQFVIGRQDLSLEREEPLAAETTLQTCVRLAITLSEQSGINLGLGFGIDKGPLLKHLNLAPADLSIVRERYECTDLGDLLFDDRRDPREIAELPAILRSVIEARRADAAPFLEPLERDVDRLHRHLVHLRTSEEERLTLAKRAALAEFAAGASHEINNPLAVISGQSQYLLARHPEEKEKSALESIKRQVQRIHSLLNDLMQFARPPAAQIERIFLPEAILPVVAQFQGLAQEMGVELRSPAIDFPLWIDADPRLIKTSLGCLIRNAIEATASKKGWVQLACELVGTRVEIRVEDNGIGLTLEQREHMFDPFYSGRSAGRGRGMGLSTAWRLAKQLGGDVRLASAAEDTTRFVLALPLPEQNHRSGERLTA